MLKMAFFVILFWCFRVLH